MKIDIARQPLVPAFMTLFALAVAAMCAGIPVSDTSGAVRDALPLLGGQLARFQAAYPVWSKFAAGFMLLFTGMCAGRITIRYNLYTVGTCLPIPLYAIVACGIATGGNYLAGFAASMLLALATKNYCRAFCNGYGFDAIFRASLYLGLMPLIYAVIGCVGFGIWGYCVYPATMNSIITRAGLATLSQGDSLMIGINCAVVGLAAFFLGTAAMPRVMKSKGRIAVTAAAVIALAVFGGVVLAMTWSHLA